MDVGAADNDGREEEDRMEAEEDSDDEDYAFSHGNPGPDLCEQIWLQIKHNEPKLTAVTVRWGDSFMNTVDWENESHYIGANTSLKKIFIYGVNVDEEYETDGRKKIIDFCKGLACNKSIEYFGLSKGIFLVGSMFAYLWPFFENNCQLKCLQIMHCTLSGESVFMLAQALSRCKSGLSSLQQFEFDANLIRDESALAKLISVLEGHGDIKQLTLVTNSFRRNGFGRIGCASLGSLLQNPTCNIKALYLNDSKINDEGLIVLSQMLLRNNTLKKLSLSGNDSLTVIGWEAFSDFLKSPGSSLLRELDIGSISIDDQGAAALADSLENNSTLRSLNISCNKSIGVTGWCSFSSVLRSPNSALKKLDLYLNNIDDVAIAALAAGLKNNKTMRTLDLSCNLSISSGGWRAFFSLFQSSKCVLEDIDLSGNNIDNDGAVAMGALLGSIRSLKRLNLDSNEAMASKGNQRKISIS